jgi:hypothetical protein
LQKLKSPVQHGLTGWSAATVQIDEETFALSLGWRISPTTQKIVSLLMGEPGLCPSGARQPDPVREPKQAHGGKAGAPPVEPANILRANSCVMSSIVSLLSEPARP